MLSDQSEKREEKDSQDSDIKEPEPKSPSPATACPVRKNTNEDKDTSDELKHNEGLSNGVKMQQCLATAGEKETQNLVVITEEEFMMARRLLSNQRFNVGEQRYHRGRPVRADKIDDNEFTFYTDNALKQEK
ncbi:MAG: hypothetical protein V1871_06135 [Planctomycetota bacterium]